MPKNHEIRVKLNQEELEKIQRKAKEIGMLPSQFLRFIGLTANISVSKEI